MKKPLDTTRSDADLHLHTIFSDGTYTPAALVKAAKLLSLRAIAVTDHDTLDGVDPVKAAAGGSLEVVAGVEFSIECGGSEIHLLGLFVDPSNEEIQAQLSIYRRKRVERIAEILDKLAAMKVNISAEDVFRYAGRGTPGRLHVAMAMIERGHARDIGTAFGRYLGAGRPAYVRKGCLTARRTMEIVRAAGGVSVLAHPGITRRDDLLPELVAAGLQGIEVFTGSHTRQQERAYMKVARERGLLVSGGSDCHGLHKDKPLIGSVRLPDDRLEALRAASHAGRAPHRSRQ